MSGSSERDGDCSSETSGVVVSISKENRQQQFVPEQKQTLAHKKKTVPLKALNKANS